MAKDKHIVTDLVVLNNLELEIGKIFTKVEQEFGLTKNQYLVMVALWDKGPLSMKELDSYVDIKPYYRTKFYNELQEAGWIYKQRPMNDERTVMIYYNVDKLPDKENIIKIACTEIKSNMDALTKNFHAVMNLCED